MQGGSFGFKPRLQSDSSPANSSGGVKFSLDAATSNGLDDHDVTIIKSDSPTVIERGIMHMQEAGGHTIM